MDFAERVREFASRIPAQLDHIHTEEATKNSLVLPLIAALGYNVFDPMEVTPELTADVGTKKGEKVDYAILRDGEPIMLVECKQHQVNLNRVNPTQLYRYFSVTEARVGILTNGVVYRFFSDLESPNRLDSKPFLEIDLLALDDSSIAELWRFSKESYSEEKIVETATDLKYTREIKRALAQEFGQPSEDFVRYFAAKVYEGRMTQAVREQFAELTRKAIQGFISDRISDRLKAAAQAEEAGVAAGAAIAPAGVETEELEERDGIETTEEELQAFYIVKAVLSQVVNVRRVALRDHKSYCSILLDDNNRKPLCRLWFNTSQKYLGLFDGHKTETRHPIAEVDEIFAFASQLTAAVRRLDGKTEP